MSANGVPAAGALVSAFVDAANVATDLVAAILEDQVDSRLRERAYVAGLRLQIVLASVVALSDDAELPPEIRAALTQHFGIAKFGPEHRRAVLDLGRKALAQLRQLRSAQVAAGVVSERGEA